MGTGTSPQEKNDIRVWPQQRDGSQRLLYLQLHSTGVAHTPRESGLSPASVFVSVPLRVPTHVISSCPPSRTAQEVAARKTESRHSRVSIPSPSFQSRDGVALSSNG